jgi:hypothetical protein
MSTSKDRESKHELSANDLRDIIMIGAIALILAMWILVANTFVLARLKAPIVSATGICVLGLPPLLISMSAITIYVIASESKGEQRHQQLPSQVQIME